MIRESICPMCHKEVEIDEKGRCVICGHLILRPLEKPKKAKKAKKKAK